ncbi:uroporphyrinogen decarboxylase family protein [Eubacteriaceae bacterium ES2]|nr:uroporphyrinogen decarboxylase family protein [Eubacteriaceae bacterium ES2]
MDDLYQSRLDRITTTAAHQEPDCVPFLHVAETWNLNYAGVTASEIENDMQKEFESFCKPYEVLDVDAIATSSLTREVRMYDTLGGGAYFYSSDGVTIQHKESVFMKDNEYSKLIDNPMGFTLNEIFLRKYPELNKPYPQNLESLKKSFGYYNRHLQRLIKGIEFHRKYDVPCLTGGVGQAPFDMIMDYYRGFKGIMTDMRRRPKEIQEACEALVPIMMASIMQGRPSLESFPYVFFPLHAPTFLNAKQFENLYWPSFRKILYQVKELGGKALIALEGDWTHLYDFVNDFPKDFAITFIEKDDMAKAKKEIGDTVTLAGGIELGMLRSSSVETCVDHVKSVIDQCAPGGGFIFTTDKSLLSPGDVRIENYIAVNKAVREFGKY